jgi:hypothetical protein
MKKSLSICVLSAGLLVGSVAQADGWRHGGGHYVYRDGMGWVVPAIVGGVIGYELNRPRQPEVVVIQPQPVYPAPVQVPPAPPYGYHWEAILDASCNCYRTVLIPN